LEAGDVFAAFRDFAQRMRRASVAETNGLVVSLVAAARLLAGEIEGAAIIVECLPAQPHRSDHGAGYCLVAPVAALRQALPLPADLEETKRWCAGTEDQARLRAWIQEHQARLVWQEREGRYTLPV
jgi:hypothetical protein